MGLEGRSAAGQLQGASGRGRAEELEDTSRANESRGLAKTSGGDGTRKSDRDIGGGRFSNGTGASNNPDGTGEEDNGLRVGTRVGIGSADHRSIRFMSASGSKKALSKSEPAAAPSPVTMAKPLSMDKPECFIDTESGGKLYVKESALQILQKIEQPVVVVAVVGLYRTGKSYLMNRLAGKQTGFALGSTIESKTKGIWMWCVPHPTKAGTTLVLLDTEGLGDVDKGDSKHDSNIFCLAVLLSSTLVYNSRGTIDNRAIEELHNFPYIGHLYCVSSQRLQASGRHIVGYPVAFLEVRGTSKKVMEYNLPRECIQNYFPSRKCFTFPFPTAPENVSRLEKLDSADMSSEFLEVTDNFCKYVFQKSDVKKLKDGITVSGRVLGYLAKNYVDTISSGVVPCLENAVIAMAMIENEAAVKDGLEVYQSGMEKLKDSFPLELKDVSSEHQHLSSTATQTFMKRSFRDNDGSYLKTLEEKINKLFDGYLRQNEEASKRQCEDLLSYLSGPMTEKLKQGFYAKPGGYDLFCKDLEDIVKNYNSQANKEVKAEEVLGEFLKQKSVDSKAILQADKKLSEKEKKIKGEIVKPSNPIFPVSKSA
ncbi:hypothetical protein cypCar_00016988 [Cyprinus carpio]|nr:hypothetical protein cypCar_00016988 [Cyprinus carpio]